MAFCVWFPQKFGITADTCVRQGRHLLPRQRIFPQLFQLHNFIMGFYDRSELFAFSKEKELQTLSQVVPCYSLEWFTDLGYDPIFH